MQYSFGDTQLDKALEYLDQKKYDKIISMIRNGFDIDTLDEYGQGLLHFAIYFKDVIAVDLLLNMYARTDVTNKEPNLLPRLPNDTVDTIDYINCKEWKSNGWTPLHEACSGGNYTIVELLIAFGADINAIASNGETPSDTAFRCKRIKIANMIKSHPKYCSYKQNIKRSNEPI